MKNIFKRIFKFILPTIITLIIGAITGIITYKYFSPFIDKNIKGSNPFITIFALSLILIVALYIHVIMHEAGHLVFGLMTGYSFVSFRIGSHTIVRQDGKLKYKKFNIPGTLGQCLMMPPEMKDGKYPFAIYNFGGVIINLILSIVAMFIAIYTDNLPDYINFSLFTFGIVGILLALTNGIPLKVGGIPNDAYNVLSMNKDEDARNGFHLILTINGLQSQGMRLKDMDFNLFELKEGVDYSSPLNTSIGLLQYSWYLDNMDFEMAKTSIDHLMPYFNELVVLHKWEINCERIFLELIGNCNKSKIDNLYDKNLKKYIKSAKYLIGKKRILMAYEAFYNKDEKAALKYYEQIKQLAPKYAVKGEAEMELMIANWIKDQINQ